MLKPTFEDSYSIVEKIVEKFRPKWRLKAVPSLSFDDVKFIIIEHIFVKWYQFNPEKGSLEAWTSRITKNQFTNILRNNYGNISRPCLNCDANLGGNLCSIYGEQSVECELYSKWFKSKSNAYNIKLPLPMENHTQEVFEKPSEYINIDGCVNKMHTKMEFVLRPLEWKVYKYIYIEGKSDEEVSKLMGYRTSEKNRINGYKRIRQLKNSIISKAKEFLYEKGIEDLDE